MPYTAEKPIQPPSSDELRARIPGWGVDLDPKDRPSVPRFQMDPQRAPSGQVEFPDRQPEKWPRERSIEHLMLTPVFGTSCPPKGLSGVIRKYSYRRFSEARAAHWLLLLAADRVDSIESHAKSLLTLRPDNPITQTGILSEFRRHPISSRFGKKRTDVKHQWIDPIIVAGPWILGGRAVYKGIKRLRRR